MDNFRQAVESPKSWNSMGYFYPKNAFLQLKHLAEDLSSITFNYLCENSSNSLCHFWALSLHNTTRLYFLAQTLHTFDKSSPSKWKFSDLPLLELKFTKFLTSFFKQKVSFSSKFGSLFSVMRDNSSVLFEVKL